MFKNRKYSLSTVLRRQLLLLSRPTSLISSSSRKKKVLLWLIRLVQGSPGGSDSKESACNAGDLGLISGLGRSSGGGNSNTLQYSCLGDPIDRGAWWAIVPGVGHGRVCTHRVTTHTHCPCSRVSLLEMSVPQAIYLHLCSGHIPSHSLAYLCWGSSVHGGRNEMPLLPPGPSYILQTSISSKEGDIFISVCFLYHLVQDSEKKGHEGPLRTQTVFF